MSLVSDESGRRRRRRTSNSVMYVRIWAKEFYNAFLIGAYATFRQNHLLDCRDNRRTSSINVRVIIAVGGGDPMWCASCATRKTERGRGRVGFPFTVHVFIMYSISERANDATIIVSRHTPFEFVKSTATTVIVETTLRVRCLCEEVFVLFFLFSHLALNFS